MRFIPPSLLAHLRRAHQTTALCWRVEPVGKAAEGYTTHDRDLVIGAVTYRALANVLPTAFPASINLNVDAVDVTTLYHRSRSTRAPLLPIYGVTPQRLATEYYKSAKVTIFSLNWRGDLSEQLNLFGGNLGKAEVNGAAIKFELLPLSNILNQTMGRETCPSCPWQRFGRGNCLNERGNRDGIDIATRTVSGQVASAASKSALVLSGIARMTGWADMGILRFTSGANGGVEREVKTWLSNGQIRLSLSLPFLPDAGDTVELEEGCLRTWDACKAKGNTKNFGGHPFLPGQNKLQTRHSSDS